MRRGNVVILVLLAITAIAAAGALGYWWRQRQAATPAQPLTWEECIKIPNARIATSYPGVCYAPDGRNVTQPLSGEEKKNLQPPSEAVNWEPYKIVTGDILDTGSWKKHSDTQNRFYVLFPPNWFFDHSVLTNYDVANVKPKTLPKNAIKCDIGPMSDFHPDEKLLLSPGDPSISVTSWITTGEGEPAGLRRYGYLFEKEERTPISFVCFFWDPMYNREVKTVVKSFTFL